MKTINWADLPMPIGNDNEISRSRERALIETAAREAGDNSPSPAARSATMARLWSAPIPSDSFPGYIVINRLTGGGQGVVYRALHEATGREVAIKVLREPVSRTDSAIERFDREVRILAQLKHPGIVTVHDSAATHSRHYFVMDYIDGRRLDRHLAEIPLSLEDTLRLFLRVCDAVHAAHLRGVIHRDLKPGNILVDLQGQPHILDFGLAKLSGHELGLQHGWAVTTTGQFVGSLPWASPEQAGGAPEQVDLRTDIYSLGVILFQMLTGAFPYPVEGPVRDVFTNILEVSPSRPSRWRKEVGDELDLIVLKCLAKEPDRRYQSAAALSDDVQRYLYHQPVLARPASTTYQLRKWVDRHRLSSALLMTIFLTVVAFGGWMSVLYRRASAARDAEHAQREVAEAAEQRVRGEAKKAQRIGQFLQDMLTSADPFVGSRRDVTVRESLDAASKQLDSSFQEEPAVVVALRNAIGLTYLGLGDNPSAVKELRAALRRGRSNLGEEDSETLAAMHNLARALHAEGQTEEAESLYRRALDGQRRLLGPEDPATLSTSGDLGMFLLVPAERRPEAEALLTETLSLLRGVLGEDHRDTLACMNNLASLYNLQGRSDEAEPLFREILDRYRRTLGEDHPNTLVLKNNLASLLRKKDALEEAEAIARDAYESSKRVLGEDHFNTQAATGTLAGVLKARGKLDEAASLYHVVATKCLAVHGEEDRRTLTAMNNYASGLEAIGQLSEAEAWFRRAFEVSQRTIGSDAELTRIFQGNYGNCLRKLGRLVEAEVQLLEAHGRLAASLGEGHPRTLRVKSFLVDLYQTWGLPEKADQFNDGRVDPSTPEN